MRCPIPQATYIKDRAGYTTKTVPTINYRGTTMSIDSARALALMPTLTAIDIADEPTDLAREQLEQTIAAINSLHFSFSTEN
jgi:hypothetical protein